MTSRLLPREEWSRLDGTELGEVYPLFRPDETKVMVVEDADGAIIGCWALFQVWHAEGVYVAPSHRGKAGVARRLLALLRSTARSVGATRVVTGCCSDEVRQLLAGLKAVRLPADHFAIPMER